MILLREQRQVWRPRFKTSRQRPCPFAVNTVASGTIGQKFRLAHFRGLRPSKKIKGAKENRRGQTNLRHPIEGESELKEHDQPGDIEQ